ncbi:PLP-dependent aminotransferase family protein [Cupriavidus sp. 2SB]|uniref:aminotransferase-like domain-containing protein n=1 Tax=Cupriavidus sp. 2SB TaxID=2502199 RepID=UPI0010F8C39D|nr:PLP-dependent aminotransferase family protein [Cupriavidus sp. 2SB]
MPTTPRDADLPNWIGTFVAGPRYVQIADFLERAVAGGKLSPGDRLAPQRELAAMLGVDLTTVTRALAEARRRGLITARGSQGTYIAAPAFDLVQAVDLSMNVPPPPAEIDFDDMLRRGLAQVTVRADASLLMTYQLGGGTQPDRTAGAQWLAPILGTIAPASVIACPGAQSALAALILCRTAPDGVVATEPLVYPGIRAAAKQLGREVVTIAVDDDGMRPDALDAACASQRVQLLYLNPTLQNPTTHTMPESRRRELARIAQRRGITIVEDDPYWLLTPDAPPPFAAIAPAETVYIATLSKCLSPGLRTAYAVTPDTALQESFLAALRALTLMASPVATALATQWIHDGSALALLMGIREEAAARQDIARQWLVGNGPQTPWGIHVWHPLPSYWNAAAFSRAARDEDLRVTASDVFADGSGSPNAIRISLGGAATRAQLSAALRKLSGLFARKPSDAGLMVV